MPDRPGHCKTRPATPEKPPLRLAQCACGVKTRPLARTPSEAHAARFFVGREVDLAPPAIVERHGL